jgi:hypothetical protein
MPRFAIYARPEGPDSFDSEIEIVADRFSFAAFLLPPVWCVWYRLWGALAAVLAIAAALAVLAWAINPAMAFWLGVLLALLLAWESSSLRERALRARGWDWHGDVRARSDYEAELRWRLASGAAARQAL